MEICHQSTRWKKKSQKDQCEKTTVPVYWSIWQKKILFGPPIPQFVATMLHIISVFWSRFFSNWQIPMDFSHNIPQDAREILTLRSTDLCFSLWMICIFKVEQENHLKPLEKWHEEIFFWNLTRHLLIQMGIPFIITFLWKFQLGILEFFFLLVIVEFLMLQKIFMFGHFQFLLV